MLTPRDPYIVAMDAVVAPDAQARDDYTIFGNLSCRLGVETAFTDGRSSAEWLQWLYDESRKKAEALGVDLPSYAAFRMDPDGAPLQTPNGRIEIASEIIASFRNRDLLAHPAWYPPTEWLGSIRKQYPIHLISGQPAEKLHSQLDNGPVSRAAKINGRATIS